jgi:hypothetical protein
MCRDLKQVRERKRTVASKPRAYLVVAKNTAALVMVVSLHSLPIPDKRARMREFRKTIWKDTRMTGSHDESNLQYRISENSSVSLLSPFSSSTNLLPSRESHNNDSAIVTLYFLPQSTYSTFNFSYQPSWTLPSNKHNGVSAWRRVSYAPLTPKNSTNT